MKTISFYPFLFRIYASVKLRHLWCSKTQFCNNPIVPALNYSSPHIVTISKHKKAKNNSLGSPRYSKPELVARRKLLLRLEPHFFIFSLVPSAIVFCFLTWTSVGACNTKCGAELQAWRLNTPKRWIVGVTKPDFHSGFSALFMSLFPPVFISLIISDARFGI